MTVIIFITHYSTILSSSLVSVSGLPLWLSIVLVGTIGTVYTSLVSDIILLDTDESLENEQIKYKIRDIA